MSRIDEKLAEATIAKVKKTLEEDAWQDVIYASEHGTRMGGFILASIYIDYLAGYFGGEGDNRELYIGFIKKFMPQYNAEDIWMSMRCQLVHNYSERGSFEFTDGKPERHLKPSRLKGRLILNIESFLEDIKNARDGYFELVQADKRIRDKLVRRYHKYGILSESPIDKEQ